METLPRILFKMLGYGIQFFSPICTILRVNVKVYERGLDLEIPQKVVAVTRAFKLPILALVPDASSI